jgi:energy-coupling factor transport system ATP-binding protein
MARAGDDVAFGLENHGVPRDRIWQRVDAALAAVGFPYGRDRSTAALSGGEQQRLALAGVLALRPGLLLLDEPTAQLDPVGAALVRAVVERVRDTTLLLVEHRVAEALPLVDRVVVLEPGGGVVADGPPATSSPGTAVAGGARRLGPGAGRAAAPAARPPGATVADRLGLRHPAAAPAAAGPRAARR